MPTRPHHLNKLEPGTWVHGEHAKVVRKLRALLERATGDPAGWGPVRDEAALTEAAHLAAQHFELGTADVSALAELGDAVPVPATAVALAALCAGGGEAWRGRICYQDAPIAGAACRWLGVTDEHKIPRALAAIRRHYVPVFVQSNYHPRTFTPDERSPLGSINEIGETSVEECTLREIARDEVVADRTLDWLRRRGAADVRELALGDHEYYLLPAAVAGVLRPLLGRCVRTCGVYDAPITEAVGDGTCACDWALEGLRAAVRESMGL